MVLECTDFSWRVESCVLYSFYVKYLNRVVVVKEFCGLMTCMHNGYETDWSLFATPIIIFLSG